MVFNNRMVVAVLIAAAFAAGSATAAEPGFYIGASAGQTTLKAETDPLPDGQTGFNTFHFDQQETGFKGFVGYNFLSWLGIEAGYVDFGSPSDSQDVLFLGTIDGEVDASGWEGFLVGTLPIGPIDLFVKAGGIAADIELKVHDDFSPLDESFKDSNGMFAYGGGIAYNIGHFSIRAEYEGYDVDKFDDLYFISGGLTYRFGGAKHEATTPVAAPTPAPVPKSAVAAACPDGDKDGVCDAVDQCPDTPPGKRVGLAGCDCDYTLALQFTFDSAELSANDKAELDRLAGTLRNPKLGFVAGQINGYTDSTGDAAYNIALSKRRADVVAAYLEAQGVKLSGQFLTKGYGEENPVASNDTQAGRAQNRRVVIHRTDCGPA